MINSKNSVTLKKYSEVNSLNGTSKGKALVKRLLLGNELALESAEREYIRYGLGGKK